MRNNGVRFSDRSYVPSKAVTVVQDDKLARPLLTNSRRCRLRCWRAGALRPPRGCMTLVCPITPITRRRCA